MTRGSRRAIDSARPETPQTHQQPPVAAPVSSMSRVRIPASTADVKRAIQSVDAGAGQVLERAGAGPAVEQLERGRVGRAADVLENRRRLIAEHLARDPAA